MSDSMTSANDPARNGLLERLSEHLEVLLENRRRLRRAKPPIGDDEAEEATVADLVDAFERLVRGITSLARSMPSLLPPTVTTIDAQKLARALLLSGHGARWEQVVMQAIREYRMAYDNVRRYSAAELPEVLQRDLLARFRQQLDGAAQSLELLNVSIDEPQLRQPLEGHRHRVVRVVASEDPALFLCIAAVVSPGFSWSEDGTPRIDPAKVVVYGPAGPNGPTAAAANGDGNPKPEGRPSLTKNTGPRSRTHTDKSGRS